MPAIASVRWHHETIVELMLAEPTITQNEIARRMNMTPAWISIIVNSDAFNEYRLSRKAELLDPVLAASIEARLDGLAKRAIDKMLERLDTNAPISNGDLTNMAKLAVGDRFSKPSLQQNNLYVIQSPPQAKSTDAWREMVSDAIPAIRQATG